MKQYVITFDFNIDINSLESFKPIITNVLQSIGFSLKINDNVFMTDHLKENPVNTIMNFYNRIINTDYSEYITNIHILEVINSTKISL